MRTTIALDLESHARIRQLMNDRGLTFDQAINLAIRRGLAVEQQRPSPTVPRPLGARVDVTKALDLADED